MWWAAAVVGALPAPSAHGAEAVEPWEDGVTERAPRTGAARLGQAVAVGRTILGFTDLDAAIPLHAGAAERAGLGLELGGASTWLWVPAERRDAFGVRSVTAELWLWFAAERLVHGVALGAGIRPDDTATFLLQPSESANRLYLQYDGQGDLGRLDLSVLLRVGPNDRTGFEWTGAAAAIYEVGTSLAVTVGLHAAVAPAVYVVPGLRLRPTDHLEVGLAAAVGLPTDIHSTVRPPPSVAPTLELKGFARQR